MNIVRGIVVAILTCLGCTILFAIWGSYELIDLRSMLGIGLIGFMLGIVGNKKSE